MSGQFRLCPCCRLRSVASPFPVCRDCELHQGNTGPKLQRRNSDHVAAWKDEQNKWSFQARRATEDLQKQLEEAQIELEQRPTRIVHQNLDAEIVAEAKSSRDAAYKSRDMTMQALCKIRLLHREVARGECFCGKSYAKCKTAQIINESEAVERWEGKQTIRMRRGQDHYLPDNHPAMLDRRSTR